MIGLKLEHVKRDVYNRICEKVSEADIPYSQLKINYSGDQHYGDVSFRLSNIDNRKTEFEVIRILYETYNELKPIEESK